MHFNCNREQTIHLDDVLCLCLILPALKTLCKQHELVSLVLT